MSWRCAVAACVAAREPSFDLRKHLAAYSLVVVHV